MYLLRIWFLLFVAVIYPYSSFALETTTEYIPPVYDYVDVYPEICNENQTKYNCNNQRCAIGKGTENSMCEGNYDRCKCKNDYWLNSTDSYVLYKDCDVHPRGRFTC
ncbi:GSCOCG00002458001-RA-CDS [Cotesia congregata]|nr:GSCOCG00002458001-RA-CDS [Cotesia congregata]